jgi:predicted phosphodiesterase
MKTYCFLSILVLSYCTSLAQETFITKPYLQLGYNPNAQSLDLVWHAADSNAIWQVEYKTDDKSKWIKTAEPVFNKLAVTGIVPQRIYHTSFMNLLAGSSFPYRVIKNGKIVFESTARAIKNVDQSYKFVVMGDIGAETPDQKALAGRAFLEEPDFVAIPGDIVYNTGLISEYKTKFWPVYNADKADANGAPLMRSIPFIAAVGNHDADTRNLDKYPDALAYYQFWFQPLNGPLGKEGGPIVPELKGSDANKKAFMDAAGIAYPRMTNFSYDYGNAHWTVIDSDTYVDWTDKELTDWVKADLEKSAAAVWHFVMFPHPGFNSSRDHYEQQQMRLLAPLFEHGKVDVVFCGHVHNYQRSYPLQFTPDKKGMLLFGGKENKTIRGRLVTGTWKLDKQFDGNTVTRPKGIIYIITGAGGQELYNPEQENDPDSWQKFTNIFKSTIHSITVANMDGNKLKIQQLTADGKVLDAFSITK